MIFMLLFQAPDYYDVIKKPIDFSKIKGKLNECKYTSDDEFLADIMLVFQNCQQYNLEVNSHTEYLRYLSIL